MWRTGTADAADRLCLPDVDQRAVAGLKFSEALPTRLATAVVAQRMADLSSAADALRQAIRIQA
jgi:ATP-dependent Lhr-like helicase